MVHNYIGVIKKKMYRFNASCAKASSKVDEC